MGQFLISLSIISLMLIEKYFFYNLEDKYSNSLVGKIELFVLLVLFFLGIISFLNEYIKNQKKRRKVIKIKPKIIPTFLLILTFFTVSMTFNLNLNKKSIHWDAIALYDARAKFISNGMKFSEMPSLSKYDNLNKYYYLLYPPYTSISHYFWNQNTLTSLLPVGTFYSILLVFLLIHIYLFVKEYYGSTVASILVFITASNSSIFNVVIKEYTNLPFDLYLVAGTLLLFSYIKFKKHWKLLFGILLISTSIWIRLLEPMWLAVAVSFGIVLLSEKLSFKNIKASILLLIVCLMEYLSWTYFTKIVATNPGFLNFSYLTLIDPIFAFFTGAFFVVLFTIAKSWGLPFFVHIGALVSIVLRWKYVFSNKAILFLAFVILFSISIYFAEFYMLSFQADWWSIVTQSLDRSGSFLIPISGFVLLALISESKLFKDKID